MRAPPGYDFTFDIIMIIFIIIAIIGGIMWLVDHT